MKLRNIDLGMLFTLVLILMALLAGAPSSSAADLIQVKGSDTEINIVQNRKWLKSICKSITALRTFLLRFTDGSPTPEPSFSSGNLYYVVTMPTAGYWVSSRCSAAGPWKLNPVLG